MRITSSLLVLCLANVTACSSDDSGGAQAAGGAGGGSAGETSNGGSATGGGGASSASFFDDTARAEMEALGIEDYQGRAVITNEEQQGDVVRVTFDPASGPICMRGAEFAAFYQDKGSDKTMILLDGGGACWSGLCAADETADAVVAPIGPAADAFFADWNLVFAPYCDGSVFSGDNDFVEPGGATRYHHGRQNLAAALDLAVEHFGDSTKVLLGGFSAGGYGCLPGMIAARMLYPEAELFIMDDSGPGVQNLAQPQSIQDRIDEWKFDEVIPASCTDCDAGHGQLSALFTWMLDNDSQIRISLLSYYEDGVIGTAFNGLTGPEYKTLLTTETGKINTAHPDRFKRFMLPGTGHVLSGSWATVTAGGVPLSAWVQGMVTGDATWADNLADGP